MIYLALSILSSTLIFVVFKLFERFRVTILHAIVVNYIVACISGLIDYKHSVSLTALPDYEWFFYTVGLGALFILVFNLMALTTQRSGLSVVSVATKMSVVIPVLFGFWYYKDEPHFFKILGVCLALVAVYLTSVRSRDGIALDRRTLLLPLLVFLGSGIIDTSIKFLEDAYVAQDDVPLFSSVVFGAAACVGVIILIVRALRGQLRFTVRDVLGGIGLGVPNYFSIYFLVHALRSDLLDSSGIFTVNNVAIVMMSTLVGITVFREKLLPRNWLGIILAVISIFLVALSIF